MSYATPASSAASDTPAAAPNPGKIATHLLIAAAASVASFLLFLLILSGVRDDRHKVTAFDHDILQWMGAHHTPTLTTLATFLAAMGEPKTIVGIAIVGTVLGFFFRRIRGAAWTMPVAIIGSGILIQSVKLTFHRARPDVFTPLLHETGYSFPSGHSLISIVVYGLFGYFAMHLFKHRAARFAVGVVTVAVIVAIGVSRVYVGVHYPTDVLAGWSLGLPWLVGCLALHERLAKRFGGKVGEPVFAGTVEAAR